MSTASHGPIAAIGPCDVRDLMVGGTVYASGGGRRTSATVVEWTTDLLATRGQVPVVAAAELPSDTLCAAVGIAGSAVLFDELLPTGAEFTTAVRLLEHHLRTTTGALVPLNTGGSNAVLPVAAASELGLPLVDADGIGRSFSLLEATVYRLGGVSPTPMALAGSGGEAVLVDAPPTRVEAITRPFVLACGGWAAVAMYPMPAAILDRVAIPGSLTRTLHAGRVVREAAGLDASALARKLGGRHLVSGRVLAVTQHDPPGRSALPARPISVTIREHQAPHRIVRLEARNEIALALTDGAVAATAPDCFCLLGLPHHELLDIERIESGMDVTVLVLPAADQWRTAEGMAITGPRAYGFPAPPGS
ncbi:DUF917 domain-containing protein [Amycolatopsis sp. CA-230715]|uniref:DUF917 domain-containing protein n=1 Tax=Amycolatopsis sp. CA-230715 TaxID=2745196 RepID=UPI001C025D61|nr:DUF917 domain-containing protein [Amycolatopsis sp. CA-230715]QWF85384.1 hypothetical protein HUW46_08838 [Amycolatopsis sp. CA-230715]